MKAVKVVCGLIRNEGKIFIARRKPGKAMAGYWEFPGGKIENGELPELALKRELEEELGMQVDNLKFFAEGTHSYETFDIHLFCYSCRLISDSSHLLDHDKVAFVYPQDLKRYNIAPADLFIVERIVDLSDTIS